MEELKITRPRISAALEKGNPFVIVAAALLAITGVLCYFLPITTGLLIPVLMIASAILIYFSAGRYKLLLFTLIVLGAATAVFYIELDADIRPFYATYSTLPVTAALFLFLSAVGWRHNVVFSFLPKQLAKPVLSLISLILLLFCTAYAARIVGYIRIPTFASFPVVLAYRLTPFIPLVSMLFINLAAEQKLIEPTGEPYRSAKSVPGDGSLFTVAAWVLLAVGAVNMFWILTASYNADAFLLSLPMVASGVFLVAGKRSEKCFLAAVVLLMSWVALSFFGAIDIAGIQFWTLPFPVLIMLISAIGIKRNTSPAALSKITKAPLLNLLVILLLLVNLASRVTNILILNAVVADDDVISLFTALRTLLPIASLVFLNLVLDSRKSMQHGVFAAFVNLCRSVVRWFYRDVGGKLKILATIQGVICIVLACLSALSAAYGLIGFLTGMFFTGFGADYLRYFIISLGGIAGSFILALPSLLLYAFGSMTKDLREIKESGVSSGSATTERENPDELPEI